MPIYIEVNGKQAEIACDVSMAKLKDLSRLYRKIAPELRTMIRDNITNQTGKGGQWAPLAKSTVEKTGHRKAFITLRNKVIGTWNFESASAIINIDSTKWNMRQHATGFTSPTRFPVRVQAMHWSTKAGPVFARRANPSVVPPRDIHPSAQQIANRVEPIVREWLSEIMRESWQ